MFFISVGMSVDLGLFLASWAGILLLVAALVAVKGAVLFALCRLFGLGTASALRTSLLMTQGGEFGFVLFGEAAASGVMDAQLHTTALLVISVSMAGTPLLARLADRLAPDAGSSEPPGTSSPTEPDDHVLVAGYGRVGQAVGTMLEQAGVSCLAFDLDPDRIAAGRAVGRRVIYGDASEPRLLEQAGAGRAAALVVALDQPNATERVVSAARSLYPALPIIARAHDLAGRDVLERLGVHEVILGDAGAQRPARRGDPHADRRDRGGAT